MSSRRTLTIIIAILVLVDIIAGLWYLSLRAEADGERQGGWSADDTEEVIADTISDRSEPDSFLIIRRNAHYLAEKPAVAGDRSTCYANDRYLALRWPVGVNGSRDIPSLHRALIGQLTSSSTDNVDLAINDWLGHPRFPTDADIEYHKTQFPPKVAAAYCRADRVLIYPLMTSVRLLVMEIDRSTVTEANQSATSRYVHYDRVQHRVLTATDILEQDKETQLLALINEKISQLNSEKNLQLQSASSVPGSFCARRAGIIFEFPAGEIAPVASGVIEVLVDYPKLNPVLTSAFIALLKDNDGYWNYKRLSISE